MGAQFAMFPDAYAFEIVNIASDGRVVLTERLDYIRTPAGTVAGVPVMGTFVVDGGGKITRWTDYFDVSLTVKLLQGETSAPLCQPPREGYRTGRVKAITTQEVSGQPHWTNVSRFGRSGHRTAPRRGTAAFVRHFDPG